LIDARFGKRRHVGEDVGGGADEREGQCGT
jgi:hypothetical protein